MPSNFDTEKAKVKDWQTIDIIFQLTEDDIKKNHSLFETKKYSDKIIESYLFFALSLTGDKYTRGDLVRITREINKLTPMPAMILFKYNNYLTIAVIDRRLHKRESTKDVLEKVTLIKDIQIPSPPLQGGVTEGRGGTHRAHIEILYDLSLDALQRTVGFTNFVELHNAWRKTLDTSELNKKFFNNLFYWYLWAVKKVKFPQIRPKEDLIPDDAHQSESVIRLLTRLLFCWFMKEKQELIPELLFDKREVKNILTDFSTENEKSSVFYRAILQNLFFATLSVPIKNRKYIRESFQGKNKDYGNQYVYRYQDEFVNAKENLKVLDPACGSGAFPMGILHKLVLILRKVDPKNKIWFESIIKRLPDYAQSEMRKKLEGENWDYLRKLGIIQQSIYGVDIQPIAIQIAKLRFFISLLVDQDIKGNAENNFGLQPLPNLDFKLVAANTLIGAPEQNQQDDGKLFFAQDEFFDKFNALTGQYFGTYEPAEKKNLVKKIEKLVGSKVEEKVKQIQSLSTHTDERFSKHVAEKNKAIIEQKKQDAKLWQSYNNLFKHESVGFFETKYFFPEVKDGFDVVIGNPPYIRQEDLKPIKPILEKQGYQVFNSTSDIYTYFYEKGWQVLNSHGHLTFITSNKWMRAKYGEKLRRLFKKSTVLWQIIDFGGHKVFESATVDTNIIIFQKYVGAELVPAQIKGQTQGLPLQILSIKSDFNHHIDLPEYFNQNAITMNQQDLDEKCFTFGDDDVMRLKKKIEQKGVPLKDWDVRICFGIKTGFNEAFIIDNDTKERLYKEDPKSIEVLKPILRGRDIQRYSYKWAGLWLIKIESGWTDKNRGKEEPERVIKETYPAVYNHFKSKGESKGKGKGLYHRDDQGDYWWELRDCDYYGEFEKEKIIYRDVGDNLSFAYEQGKLYGNNTVYFLNTGNKYLLAVLNSLLLNFYYTKISSQLGDAANRAFTIFIEQLPIPKIPESAQQPFITLVDQILAAKKDNPSADTSALERQIDDMVYELYGLTEDEIAIVEGKK